MQDPDITWYAEVPDFSEYFQQIVFVLIPCSIFVITALPHILRNCRRTSFYSLPWTLLLITKLIFCIFLLVLSIMELLQNVSETQNVAHIAFYSGIIKMLSLGLIFILLLQHKRLGTKLSVLLQIFWLILSICGTIMFRSILLKVIIKDFPLINREKFMTSVVQYSLIYCELFLSLFMETKSNIISEKRSPIENVPALLFITYLWMTGLLVKSMKKLLTVQDFAPLSIHLQSSKQFEKFNLKWNPTKSKNKDTFFIKITTKHPSLYLAWVCVQAFWKWILYSSILTIILNIAIFIPPLLLDLIINFISSEDYLWKGYFYCGLIFIASAVVAILENGSGSYSTLLAIQIKAALFSAIYRKAMKISNSTRRNYTSGQLVNLMTIDIDKIYNFVVNFYFLILVLPLRIILTTLILWHYLGLACVFGIFIIIGFTCLSLIISKRNGSFQVKKMAATDIRMKYLSEILNSIKVLKFWAWENAFMNRISHVRKDELHFIKIHQLLYALIAFIYSIAPIAVTTVCFAAYVLMDPKNVLYPSTAFVTINLLNNLRNVMYLSSYALTLFIQAKVAFKRISAFLLAEEENPKSVEFFTKEDNVNTLMIENASFSWYHKEDVILNNINLRVGKGDLVAVIGNVGSGKSSLISACLGNMYKLYGSIKIQGTLAYVPQQAWIRNETVRENIILMKMLNESVYNSILDACALKLDLESFPNNDMTEIGEKGINLSGGQRQRISLARSVYQNADVYLLDDPLSAVDVHVGKYIFDKVIGKNGQLKEKTRIFVTHNYSFLSDMDLIVCMKDGRIEETGTYDDLMNRSDWFAKFTQKHENSVDESKEKQSKFIECQEKANSLEIFEDDNNKANSERNFTKKLIEDEKVETGAVKKVLYVNYAKRAGPFIFIFAVLVYLFHEVLQVGANFWLREWSNDSLGFSRASEITYEINRNKRIGIYVLLGFGQAVTTAVGNIFLILGGIRASRCYHDQMLKSIMKSPLSFFEKTPQGRIVNRFSTDLIVVDMLTYIYLDGFFLFLTSVVGILVVISVTTPLFLISVIPLFVLYYYVLKLYLSAARQIKRMECVKRSPIFSIFTETIQGASSIKAYNMNSKFTKMFESRVDDNLLCQFYWTSCCSWLIFQLSLISCVIVLLASVLSVYYKESLSGATAGMSLSYAFLMSNALNLLCEIYVELENQSISIERLDEYTKLATEAPSFIPENQPIEEWPKEGLIRFKNYKMRYREELSDALDKINLKILPKEKVGIVGRTGAGKSSIVLALFRIIEATEGNITIDSTDIAKIGLHDLRSKLTIIPQEPVLFSGSLRFNLDPNNMYGDDELWISLEHSHMKSYFSSFPEGLETEISESGENLSVGQRQLVCLARALLKKTKILILDEATAAIDSETDGLIQKTIRNVFTACTVITIAHRLNTIMDYDRVIVMDSGRIVESGIISELLNNSDSYFHAMAKKVGLI